MLTSLTFKCKKTGHTAILEFIQGNANAAPILIFTCNTERLFSEFAIPLSGDQDRQWKMACLVHQTVEGQRGCNGDIAQYLTYLQMLLP